MLRDEKENVNNACHFKRGCILLIDKYTAAAAIHDDGI